MSGLSRRVERLAIRFSLRPPRIEDLSDAELLRVVSRGEPNPVAFLAKWTSLTTAQQDSQLIRIGDTGPDGP